MSRPVSKVLKAIMQKEGQGANVARSIGSRKLPDLDPFLLLDEFFVESPAGFPDHPHRGFETVTYMLFGGTHHKDNHGHEGVITTGGLQWMTAGKGIIHSEMPANGELSHGLQLWVNLAAKHKMVQPKYQELDGNQVPIAHNDDNTVTVRVIAGKAFGIESEVRTITPAMYLDVSMHSNAQYTQPVESEFNTFVYVLEGEATFGHPATVGGQRDLLILGPGESVDVSTNSTQTTRFVLIAGKPLGEPVAKYGPFVMNTQEEIEQAFSDYQSGLF